jgi:hypothetical protein
MNREARTLAELTVALTNQEKVRTVEIIDALKERSYDYEIYRTFAQKLTQPDTHDGSYGGSDNTRYLGAISAAADIPGVYNCLVGFRNMSPSAAIRSMLTRSLCIIPEHAFAMFRQYCQESSIDITAL